MLVEADTILEAAGGMVGYFLIVAGVATIPLSLGKGKAIRLLSFLVLLSALNLAYRDHVAGLERQARVLRVQITAELKAATQP
jgi:lysylphosphatidylglycerol synthetase-like protein (DUF2156 family)